MDLNTELTAVEDIAALVKIASIVFPVLAPAAAVLGVAADAASFAQKAPDLVGKLRGMIDPLDLAKLNAFDGMTQEQVNAAMERTGPGIGDD